MSVANGYGPYILSLLFSATYMISPQPSKVDTTNNVGNAVVILSKLCLKLIYFLWDSIHSYLLISNDILSSQNPNWLSYKMIPKTPNIIQTEMRVNNIFNMSKRD